MLEPNETHDRIQNIRVKNLEQQVHLLRAELQRIRKGFLPQKDVLRLTSLADKLKELNDVLKDLRNHYNMEKMQKQKFFQSLPTTNKTNWNQAEVKREEIEITQQYEENYFRQQTANGTNLNQNGYQANGFEQLPSSKKNSVENSKENYKNDENNKIMADVEPNNSSIDMNNKNIVATNTCKSDDAKDETFKVCKQILNESKPPGSILGNNLIKLQDYRTDPELRRQRLERKEKEKLQKLREKNYGYDETKEATNGPIIQRESGAKSPEISSNNQYRIAKKSTTNGSFVQRGSTESSPNPVVDDYSNAQNQNEKATINGSTKQRDSTDNSQKNSAPENFVENQPENAVYHCSTANKSCTESDAPIDILIIRKRLKEVICDVIGDIDHANIALTVVLETDQIYHVSVSITSSGESLACFFATEEAIEEAKKNNLFQDFLTLFVVNAENSIAQKNRILGHSFEFIKLNV